MAQHRTKQDKLKAQIRRESIQYSLEGLPNSSGIKDNKSLQSSVKQGNHSVTDGANNDILKHFNIEDIQRDMIRSVIALSVVASLLAFTFFTLQ